MIYFDNNLLHRMSKDNALDISNIKDYTLVNDIPLDNIDFNWSSLLSCIGENSLFESLKFDPEKKIFNVIISTLALNPQKEILLRLYDQIFVEFLTLIKSLPQVNANFLLEKISASESKGHAFFNKPLQHYKSRLADHTRQAMHDLVLYLAWDQVCNYIANIFDFNSTEFKIKESLQVFLDALTESFRHIFNQGKIVPSFFRLSEAVYSFQMRDENLQGYSESEWSTLSQSSKALKPKEMLANAMYIDATITEQKKIESENTILFFTLDSPEVVDSTLQLARYVNEKIALDTCCWSFSFHPAQIVCLTEKDAALQITGVIQ